MATQALLIYNPKSGRQQGERLVPQLLSILRDGGFDIEARPTSGPGNATEIARNVVNEHGVGTVFGLGGDGTLREVAAGLLDTEAVLGTLPAGTTNVLPAALGLTRDPLVAAQRLVNCRPRPFDVGMAGDQPFLMMLSCGFDAAVMAGQNAELKKRLGKAAVALSGLQRFWTYEQPRIQLRVDGHTEQASFLALCNIPFYAGDFRLAPEAQDDDGQLDLVLFRGRGRLAFAGLARDLVLGRHTQRPDVVCVPVSEAELLGPCDLDVQIDGDVLSVDWPLKISILPAALRVLAP